MYLFIIKDKLSHLIKDKLSYWLTAVQQGFILILPVVILGSIALSLLQLPYLIPSLEGQNHLLKLASYLYLSSYSIMALVLTLGISYKLSSFYKIKYNLPYSPITNTTISFVCFIGIVLIDHGNDPFNFLGVASVATAIISAVISTELTTLFYNNKYQRFSFLQFEISTEIHVAIRACIPAIIIPFVVLGAYYSFFTNTNWLGNLIPFLIGGLDPETGLSFIQGIGLIIINQSLWLLGIHPSSLIEINPELIYGSVEAVTYSRQFINSYAHLGGAGSTLGLIICLLFSRNRFHKK